MIRLRLAPGTLALLILCLSGRLQAQDDQLRAKRSNSTIYVTKARPIDSDSDDVKRQLNNIPNYIRKREEKLRDHFKGPPEGLKVSKGVDDRARNAVQPGAWTEFKPLAADEQKVQFVQVDGRDRNFGLNSTATGGAVGLVAEPSVASSKGGSVLITGNWFAAFARDGTDFRHVDPSIRFPEDDGHDFCCDQVAHYSPAHDLMMWFLQYQDNGRTNKIRVAVSHGPDIREDRWFYYDFTPVDIGGAEWNFRWFDFPDLALTQEFLYITTNMFKTGANGGFTDSVILRMKLEKMKAYEDVDPDYFNTKKSFSLRPVQGIPQTMDTMYFGGHNYDRYESQIEVLAWPDSRDSLKRNTFMVDPWKDSSRKLNRNDWLARADARMTGAWKTGDQLGFLWSSASSGQFPQPHIRAAVVRFDPNHSADDAMSAVEQPHLWSKSIAFGYPQTAVNSDGVVGISVGYGGNSLAPSHAVGYLTEDWKWELRKTVEGTQAPDRGIWGDYLGLRPDGARPHSWVSAGFVLKGSSFSPQRVVQFTQFEQAERTEAPVIVVPPVTTTGDLAEELKLAREELQRARVALDAALIRLDELSKNQGGTQAATQKVLKKGTQKSTPRNDKASPKKNSRKPPRRKRSNSTKRKRKSDRKEKEKDRSKDPDKTECCR